VPSLSRTVRFFLCWKGWGRSPQRGQVTRAAGAAGSYTVGMSPPGQGQWKEEKQHPKKHPWGFATRLGAAAPRGRVPPAARTARSPRPRPRCPSAQRVRLCRDVLTAALGQRDGRALPGRLGCCLRSPSRRQAGFRFRTAARRLAHASPFRATGQRQSRRTPRIQLKRKVMFLGEKRQL